jgi:hypothetical protein
MLRFCDKQCFHNHLTINQLSRILVKNAELLVLLVTKLKALNKKRSSKFRCAALVRESCFYSEFLLVRR